MSGDFRSDLAGAILLGSVFIGALCGAGSLMGDYKTHQELIQTNPSYRVQVLQEREVRMTQAHRELVDFCDAYASKFKIPFLGKLFD